jgi:hypothetical protein
MCSRDDYPPLPADWEAPYTGPSQVKLTPVWDMIAEAQTRCGFCDAPSITGLCRVCEDQYDRLEQAKAPARRAAEASRDAWVMATLELIANHHGHPLQVPAITARANMIRKQA